MMKTGILATVVLFLGFSALGQSSKKEESLAPVSESIEFDKIKKVLKSDRLGAEVEKKKAIKRKKKIKRIKKKVGKYDIPENDQFWSLFSEYWLIKNATVLKWDFKKPDYGLQSSFRSFLETMGVFEVTFKILLVNSPDVTHFALPSNPNEFIFLLSVPFIRTLDLSKLEISLLLFEDYLRIKNGFFKDYVSVAGLNSFIGSNFYEKKFNAELLNKVSARYDNLIFDKGFSFKQQYKVTENMNRMLKGNSKLWNGYYLMLGKIDNLVKTNILYQKYLKIYPSPELQLSWLKPGRKKIL